jgi:protein involved in polysaccharide export with SLBB domain
MQTWIKRILFICFALALFTGCTTPETSSRGSRVFFKAQPEEALAASEILEPGDAVELSVEVDGKMEVSLHQAKLNYQGIATFPLVGDVEIGGMKLSKARDVISAEYSKYYVNPPVIMIARSDVADADELGSVTVLGRVSRPGVVPITSPRGLNLSAAIQAAGGFASSARTSRIRVTRVNENGTKAQVFINFEEIGAEGNAEADVTLQDGDIVYVPERIF